MKKALAIFMTVCMLASLFVSCDVSKAEDQLVTVSFGTEASKALSAEATYPGFDALDWWYKAAGKSTFKYGDTNSAWTKLENGLSTVVELSQGKWDFELCAVAKNTASVDGSTTKVYEGSISGVVIMKAEAPTTINVTVYPGDSGKGRISISKDISINKRSSASSGYSSSVVKATHYEIKDATSAVVECTAFSTATDFTSEELDAGDYTVYVYHKTYVGYETTPTDWSAATDSNWVTTTGSIAVTVKTGSTIVVSGTVDEETGSGTFNPSLAVTATVEKTVPASTTADTVLVAKNVTPSMVESNNTTVTVPAAVVGASTESKMVKLDVDVIQAVEASNAGFTVSTGKAAAAAIDLSLAIGGANETQFSSPVKVETYVAKNLKDFSMKYEDETWTKKDTLAGVTAAKDYYYDSTTGKLTFLTDHFSTFVAETTSEAVIGDSAYDTFAAALSAVPNNGTITLLKDVNFDDHQLYQSKDITIDINGKNFSDVGSNSVFGYGKSLKFTDSKDKKGKIVISQGRCSSGGTMIFENVDVTFKKYLFVSPDNNNTILVNNCRFNGYFTVNGSTTKAMNANVTFKNSEFYDDGSTSYGTCWYLAGYANYTFENNVFDGSISGDSPLYFKAGNVSIKNNAFNCVCTAVYDHDYIYYGNGAFGSPTTIMIDEAPGYQGFDAVEVSGNTFNLTGQYKDIWKYLVYNVNPGQSYTATVTSDIVSNKTMTQASFVAKRVVNCKIGDNAAEMIVYFSTMERANAYTVEKFKALTNEITEVTSFGDVQVL